MHRYNVNIRYEILFLERSIEQNKIDCNKFLFCIENEYWNIIYDLKLYIDQISVFGEDSVLERIVVRWNLENENLENEARRRSKY